MLTWAYCVTELSGVCLITGTLWLSNSLRPWNDVNLLYAVPHPPLIFLQVVPPFTFESHFLIVFSFYCTFSPFFFFCSDLYLYIHSSRSQCADSGNTSMMNWVATPAAQVPPPVHGDTTRGEFFWPRVLQLGCLYSSSWLCLKLRSIRFHKALFNPRQILIFVERMSIPQLAQLAAFICRFFDVLNILIIKDETKHKNLHQ